jgi:hypothetical protein
MPIDCKMLKNQDLSLMCDKPSFSSLSEAIEASSQMFDKYNNSRKIFSEFNKKEIEEHLCKVFQTFANYETQKYRNGTQKKPTEEVLLLISYVEKMKLQVIDIEKQMDEYKKEKETEKEDPLKHCIPIPYVLPSTSFDATSAWMLFFTTVDKSDTKHTKNTGVLSGVNIRLNVPTTYSHSSSLNELFEASKRTVLGLFPVPSRFECTKHEFNVVGFKFMKDDDDDGHSENNVSILFYCYCKGKIIEIVCPFNLINNKKGENETLKELDKCILEFNTEFVEKFTGSFTYDPIDTGLLDTIFYTITKKEIALLADNILIDLLDEWTVL